MGLGARLCFRKGRAHLETELGSRLWRSYQLPSTLPCCGERPGYGGVWGTKTNARALPASGALLAKETVSKACGPGSPPGGQEAS